MPAAVVGGGQGGRKDGQTERAAKSRFLKGAGGLKVEHLEHPGPAAEGLAPGSSPAPPQAALLRRHTLGAGGEVLPTSQATGRAGEARGLLQCAQPLPQTDRPALCMFLEWEEVWHLDHNRCQWHCQPMCSGQAASRLLCSWHAQQWWHQYGHLPATSLAGWSRLLCRLALSPTSHPLSTHHPQGRG